VLRTNQGSKAILVYTLWGINQGLFRRNKRYRQGKDKSKFRKRSFASFSYQEEELRLFFCVKVLLVIKIILTHFD
jgi:hypothetical protein